MTRQVRQPAPAYARSLLTSTAFHGAVFGIGALFGVRAAVITAEAPAPAPRTQSFVAEAAPRFPADEREERLEPELTEEVLTEPDVVPVDYEPPRVAYSEARFDEPPDELPAMDAFPAVSFVPEPEPEPVPAAEPPPAAPEAKVLVVERTPPLLRESPNPEYPRLSVRLGETGSVLCLLHVAADGAVTRVEVEESSGFARLDRAAIECLETWRFRPATLGGEAVAGTYRHRVRFQLDS